MATYSIARTANGKRWMIVADGERVGNRAFKTREEAMDVIGTLYEKEVMAEWERAAEYCAEHDLEVPPPRMFLLAEEQIDDEPGQFAEHVRRIRYRNSVLKHELDPNSHRPIGGGLSDDIGHLTSLVRNEAIDNLVESGDTTREAAENVYVTDELLEIAKQYDNDVWKAIIEIVRTTNVDISPTELWEVEAPTYIFMTLQGHGLNIWDTMWNDVFEGNAAQEAVQTFLENSLGKYANIASSGTLVEAIRDAAYETSDGGLPQKGVEPI